MSVKAKLVVNKLYSLALNESNRETIAKDPMIPALVLFLDNEDPDVVIRALKTLDLLSQSTSTQPIILNLMGLMVSLEKLIDENTKPEAVSLATKLRKRLKTPVHLQQFPQDSPFIHRHQYSQTSSIPRPKSYSSRPRVFAPPPTSSVPFRTRQSIFSISPRKARTVTLEIVSPRLSDSEITRQTLEMELLKIKGIISFTFDVSSSRITLRVLQSITVEDVLRELVDRVSEVEKMSARQVVKAANGGEEVYLDIVSSKAKTTNREETPAEAAQPKDDESDDDNPYDSEDDEDGPQYLDEDEDPYDLEDYGAKSVVTKDSSREDSGSWFGTISGLVSKWW
ncbi:hypothetical protein BKA69DRAFT_938425 [Paraphysoderma sedebokerense]|nr:hypothetical protein BKA69DRAFT_938425 [Paraphysoderma sedebokerense]